MYNNFKEVPCTALQMANKSSYIEGFEINSVDKRFILSEFDVRYG